MDSGPGTRSHSGLFRLLTGLMRGRTGAPGTRPRRRRRRMRSQVLLAAVALVVVLLVVGVLSASANPLRSLGPLDVGDTYTLTYTAGADGAIDGTSPQTVDYLADGTPVTAVPDTGYHFVSGATAARTTRGPTAT